MKLKLPTKAPETLSKSSGQWWLQTVAQFGMKTSGELAVLTEAAQSLDRIIDCQKIIAEEGLFASGKTATVAHPAARLELQHRATVLQACRQLGISQPVAE